MFCMIDESIPPAPVLRASRALAPLAGLCLLACASLGAARLDQPVHTEGGLVSGVPGEIAGVRVFKGIPFAAPPVGDLRWAPPAPAEPWEDVRSGADFAPVCWQPKGLGRLNVSVDLPNSPPRSEDCLYLNVWTPAETSAERLPVMVWVYGGAYYEGAGSSPYSYGDSLASKGVVVVTLNYRLGSLGFLAHPELAAESPHGASGNYALMDVIAALKWVQNNIDAFGGDPKNVTIFGESAGAAINAGLVGSPEAAGLFDRAIAESGAWMGLGVAPMVARETAEAQTVSAAEGLGAESLADLRAMPAEEASEMLPRQGMIIDGWIIPEDLSITFAEGRQNAVDVLVGSNGDEGGFMAGFGPPMTAEVWEQTAPQRWGDLAELGLAAYPAETDEQAQAVATQPFSDAMAWHMRYFAKRQAAIGQDAWLYHFTHNPPYPEGAPDLGANHTSEIPYVFDNIDAQRVFPDMTSSALADSSAEEHAFAELVSGYWVNFAATGDPNGPGAPHWPSVTDLGPGEAMILDADGSGRGIALSKEELTLHRAAYEQIWPEH